MADFWQGSIPTLQRLGVGDCAALAAALQPNAGARRVSLVLPCHVRDLMAPAFQQMLVVLRDMTWLHGMVLGLDGGTAADLTCAQAMLQHFPMETHIISVPGSTGKGANVSRCIEFLLRQPNTEIIALHDCDISPYDAEMLLRLVTPVARPEYGYRFAKGYYARFSDRLHGRLTRLLFHPLTAAIAEQFPADSGLALLPQWRYPLAGEIAMDAALARQLTYPNGWSLETSVLLQVPQLLAPETYCQVDLCARYDHRHQPLQSVTQPVTASATSLTDAAQEIIQRILQAAPGPVKIELLAERYNAHATQARRRYQNLAHINGLTYDAADEAQACAVFAALMWPLRFRD